MINRRFKKCLITGITGSGRSYLAEHILSKDHKKKIFGIYKSLGNKNLISNHFLEKYSEKNRKI